MSEWDFLWDLQGDALIDAMCSGGTEDDWNYVYEMMERTDYGFNEEENEDYNEEEYYDNYEDFDYEYDEYGHRINASDSSEQNKIKQNTMVFIDAENISYSFAKSIYNELPNIGTVSEVRYYAMQNDKSTLGWKSTIKEYGFKPILMSGEREKNKIDNEIIKDAKKILTINKNIDVFVLVTKDSDYTSLVEFLRSNRKRVVILAPKDASRKLTNASSESRNIKRKEK